MRLTRSFFLLSVALLLHGQPNLSVAAPAPKTVTVSGTLKGRSGKPLAKAWVCLGQLQQSEIERKDVTLALTQLTAVTDDNGRFRIQGVPAGTYTLVYQPAPATGAKGGRNIAIDKLAAGIKSFMPNLRDREVGTFKPFEKRAWTREFVLLEGHTLYCTASGTLMKIWNASARSGSSGPLVEIRKNLVWRKDFQQDADVTFEAWSF